MFEKVLEWFAPGHRDEIEKVFNDFQSRIQELEAKVDVLINRIEALMMPKTTISLPPLTSLTGETAPVTSTVTPPAIPPTPTVDQTQTGG